MTATQKQPEPRTLPQGLAQEWLQALHAAGSARVAAERAQREAERTLRELKVHERLVVVLERDIARRAKLPNGTRLQPTERGAVVAVPPQPQPRDEKIKKGEPATEDARSAHRASRKSKPSGSPKKG